jgi:hypothetical protein
MVCGMNLRTPLIGSLAVVSALGGVAAAAITLPSGSAPEPTAATVAPSATPTPEVRTKTIRRTIHVVRRDKAERASSSPAPARPVAPASTPRPAAAPSSRSSFSDDSGHHRSGDDDSGHHGGGDDSGHHGGGDDDSGHHGGGDDDSGHGRGRGRVRGGDDD